MAMKPEHIMGYIFVGIIGLALMAWIFDDVVSSRINIKNLQSQIENLRKSFQSLETNRYVVYINVDTQDTLFLPAFEEMPENEIDTVNQRSEKEE